MTNLKTLVKLATEFQTDSLRFSESPKDLLALSNILAKTIYRELHETELAYGGCHNCYGKGYATVNDQWIGHDTDTDIGSPGGTIKGGNPNAMKFCACDRGKQLAKLVKGLK